MRWPWTRRPAGRRWQPPAPIPDGDRVRHPDDQDPQTIIYSLLWPETPAQQWRGRGGC